MRLMFAALAVCLTTGAAAQTTPPDPASLTLPDMTATSDPRVIRDGWKHFYFHRAGVSYEEAYRDLADCYRYLPRGPLATVMLPTFAPWNDRVRASAPPPQGMNYGVVGALIGAMISGPIERRTRQGRMRRCLEPKGYVRYPVPEETWRQLIDNYSERSIALQALVASGPTPDMPQVTR